MKPAPPAASKPTVAWTPLDNYFAIHAVGHTAVLASADDLAELVERRKLFEQLAVTLKFSIVWGIDGAAVTSAQARRILGGAGSSVDVEYMVEVDVTVDGQTRKSTETRTRKEARRELNAYARTVARGRGAAVHRRVATAPGKGAKAAPVGNMQASEKVGDGVVNRHIVTDSRIPANVQRVSIEASNPTRVSV